MKEKKKPETLIKSEQFYLRLYLHGMSDHKILKFLSITQQELQRTKKQLATKYNTRDFNIILSKTISSGLVNTNYYLSNSTIQRALYYSDLIFESYFESKGIKCSDEILKQSLLQFLEFRKDHQEKK